MLPRSVAAVLSNAGALLVQKQLELSAASAEVSEPVDHVALVVAVVASRLSGGCLQTGQTPRLCWHPRVAALFSAAAQAEMWVPLGLEQRDLGLVSLNVITPAPRVRVSRAGALHASSSQYPHAHALNLAKGSLKTSPDTLAASQ